MSRSSWRQGMRGFLIIWSGQVVSLLGTGMTRFALLVWAWSQAGNATAIALLGFFAYAPYVLISPFAGVVVDRFDRRWLMVLADMGSGFITIGLLLLIWSDHILIWHLYLAQALSSLLEAFQFPAYSASISLLVPKEQYGRASGFNSLAESASTVFSPMFAGALLAVMGIEGVMILDVLTFLVAILALSLVRIPRPGPPTDPALSTGKIADQLSIGFRYIFARPGLLGLMLIMAGMNLFAALTYFSILPAMVLARTGGDEIALASVQGALGLGGLIGGVVVSAWGGPRRKIHAILAGAACSFLLGDFLLGVARNLTMWTVAAFLASMFIPFVVGAQQAIWQAKVDPGIQGRVFSARSMLQAATFPLGFLISGPLADKLFEPALAAGGALSESLGWLVGTGPGAGIGMMFVCTSILGTIMALAGYLFPAVRHVESDLPDHDAAAAYSA